MRPTVLGPQWNQPKILGFPSAWDDVSEKQIEQDLNSSVEFEGVHGLSPTAGHLIDARWELFNAEQRFQEHVNESAEPLINEAFTPTLLDDPELRRLQRQRMYDPRLD